MYYLLDPAFYLKEVSGREAAALAPKSRFDYSRSLRKALSVPATTGVLFPADRLLEPDFPYFLEGMEKSGLIPIVQIHASSQIEQTALSEKFVSRGGSKGAAGEKEKRPARGLNVIFHDPKNLLPLLLKLKRSGFQFRQNAVLLQEKNRSASSSQTLENKDGPAADSPPGLKEPLQKPARASLNFCFFTFIVTKKGRNLQELLPFSVLKNTELYFPYKRSRQDPFLTPKEIYLYIKEGRFGPARPFTGDIYDDRLPEGSCLEPVVRPWAASAAGKKRREKSTDFSIVIPSCNNKSRLIRTLKQLTRLDFPKDRFEVIVADDGSSDGSFAALSRFIKDQKETAFKAVRFPRVRQRKPGSGEADFRAGIARNLGAKYAEGKRLAFLDSDILVPPDYLTVLKEEHEAGADLVQLQRYHLIRPLPSEFAGDLQSLKSGLYIKESAYWKPFYDKGFEGVSAPWKYVCSYGLSLSKKDFIEQGRFGRTFVYYGFEDTDLGYRMFKAGKKLKLSRIQCVHQFIPQSKREDGGAYKRRAFLSKTAKNFYLRHLDPLIFEELSSFMRQERGLSYFLPFFRRRRGGRLFL